MSEYRHVLFVYGHLASAFPHISPVGICHLAGAVDYAAHNRYYYILEAGGLLHHLPVGLLEVIHCPSAARAGDVLRLVETAPCGLHYLVAKIWIHLRRDIVNFVAHQLRAPGAGGIKHSQLTLRKLRHSSTAVSCGKVAGYRYFIHRVFGKGNPDGISYAFFEKSRNSHAALDASAVASARLGHSYVKREDSAFALHHSDKLAVALDHRNGI